MLPAPPLIARLRRSQLAGWLCISLAILQLLATGLHAGATMAAFGQGADHGDQGFLAVCRAVAAAVRPLQRPDNAPPRGDVTSCGACAVCVASTAILGEPARLSVLPWPFAAQVLSFNDALDMSKAWRSCASVRGPPAFFAV